MLNSYAWTLVLGVVLSTFPITATADLEDSPDDVARALGLPLEDGEGFGSNFGFSKNIPENRIVAPEEFKNFRVNVDVFRKSTRLPVLGEFRDEYRDVLAPASEGLTDDERSIRAKLIFKSLAEKEFSLVSVDGIPFKANIVSGAIEALVDVPVKDSSGRAIRDPSSGRIVTRRSMKTTPPGNYRLDPLVQMKKLVKTDGTIQKTDVAFPWLRSESYNNSQMFWGLWIKGGYFIHSTPHYGELGRPASMGCIRQSFPDAMELYKLLVEDGLSGMIRIHAIGAKSAVSRLREVTSMSWLLAQLKDSAQKITDSKLHYGPEVEILGHAWMLPETGTPSATVWPSCGSFDHSPIDCFKTFGVRKPKNSAN